MTRELLAGVVYKFRVLGRHGTDDGELHTRLKVARNGAYVADTATDLNRQVG